MAKISREGIAIINHAIVITIDWLTIVRQITDNGRGGDGELIRRLFSNPIVDPLDIGYLYP